MATGQAMMPILAQTFVDSKNGVVFDMIAASSPSSNLSPSRRSPASPTRRKDAKHKADANSDGSRTDIFSLSDAVLAERYQFLTEVGFGNWGSVWKCQRKTGSSPGSTVAIKLVHRSKNPTSSARVRSLWTEFKCIRALRDIPHPNIITFSSFIITPSYALIVMGYHPRLMPVALPESKAKTYFLQLLSAVDFLHAHGCSHNDIKPANILLSAEDCPILVDFGFAQQYSSSSSDRFLSSLSWGTPEYLSPERARGILHDERLSDVWALGVTMYEIVVGRTPFEKSEAEEFLTREALEVYYHRTTTGVFCGDFIISPGFESLIHTMVEPNINLRVQTCGKALRHGFFDPPLSALTTKPSLVNSLNSRMSSTPKRTDSLVHTPSSSAKKGPTSHRKVGKADDRRESIKFYHDRATPSPARGGGGGGVTASPSPKTFSARPLVLGERNGNTYPTSSRITPSAIKPTSLSKTPPPSRIPIRKCDISSPVTLPRTVFAETKQLSPSPSRSCTPSRAAVSSKPTSTTPKAKTTPSTPSRTNTKASVKTPPGSASSPIRSPPPLPILVPSPPPADAGKSCKPVKSADNEDKKVLASPQRSGPLWHRCQPSLLGLGIRSSPTTPLISSFASTTPTRTGFFKGSLSVSIQTGSQTLDVSSPTSFEFDDGGAFGRTSPIPKASTSVASKLRKMSLRRAPSAFSFRGIKSPFSHVARRRASTTGSLFSLIDPPDNAEDRDTVTMPLSCGPRSQVDVDGERARLESFSRHIQHIIDARKLVDPPLPNRPLQAKTATNDNNASVEMPILSPAEVQEFRQQVAQELAEESRKKSMSKGQAGPRACRSGSVSRRGASTSQSERPSVKIRPSLAPSFVGASSPTSMTANPERVANSSSASSVSSASSCASTQADKEVTWKRGHRRIPTAIRTVPSIYLTESADDESESDLFRAETPCSERIASPPPAPRIVEQGRQLPTWVPDDVGSDAEDEDGDVDEPTITISSPAKRKPSRTSTTRPTPKPSADGLYEQFVKATPRVERRSRSTASPQAAPQSPKDVPFSPQPDSRASSRASTKYSDAGHGSHFRARSVVSFLFSTSSSRASTPSMSMDSLSSSVSGADDDEGAARKKGGRFRRAMRKLLK